jgi:hypothetical protein
MRLTRTFTGHSLAVWLPLAVIATALSVSGAPQRTPKRKIACKILENAGSCYWAHGRLAAYNGTPTMRLWKIGTKRILAVHSGPGFKRGGTEENEDPEMPENVERAMKPFENVVFADYEICPLEPEHRGRMQDVCIESAKNIVMAEYSF